MKSPGQKARRLNKRRPAGTLKQAMAALVEANGGVNRTSDLLGNISKTQVHRYTDDAEPDAEFKVGQVRTLERFCGQPIVTAYLAAEAHCALVPLEIEGGDPLDIDLARYGKESAQLFATYAEVMGDHKLTAREAGQMKDQAMRVMSALAVMYRDLDEAMKE